MDADRANAERHQPTALTAADTVRLPGIAAEAFDKDVGTPGGSTHIGYSRGLLVANRAAILHNPGPWAGTLMAVPARRRQSPFVHDS